VVVALAVHHSYGYRNVHSCVAVPILVGMQFVPIKMGVIPRYLQLNQLTYPHSN